MPAPARVGDHVVAQRAFLLGADAEEGVTRLLIERIGLELDASAPSA